MNADQAKRYGNFNNHLISNSIAYGLGAVITLVLIYKVGKLLSNDNTMLNGRIKSLLVIYFSCMLILFVLLIAHAVNDLAMVKDIVLSTLHIVFLTIFS
jgi:hypothetical protein